MCYQFPATIIQWHGGICCWGRLYRADWATSSAQQYARQPGAPHSSGLVCGTVDTRVSKSEWGAVAHAALPSLPPTFTLDRPGASNASLLAGPLCCCSSRSSSTLGEHLVPEKSQYTAQRSVNESFSYIGRILLRLAAFNSCSYSIV